MDNENDAIDELDAFFHAMDNRDPGTMREAAENIARSGDSQPGFDNFSAAPVSGESPAVVPPGPRKGTTRVKTDVPAPQAGVLRPSGTRVAKKSAEAGVTFSSDGMPQWNGDNLDGKFVALDPDKLPGSGGKKGDAPFVLIPANIHTFVPWWGWLTIALGLVVLVTGVLLMPGVRLGQLASRLGDSDEAAAQSAMRQLVTRGDERTVRKLFTMASSPGEKLNARLRAVDTMTLIERVPEVDRALLRLELSSNTHEQVREAAIAARKQREAYKSRGRR